MSFLIFFSIIVFGLVLRLIAINQSLWLDEAIGALVVKAQSYSEIITRFPLGDNHPPLYYLTLKAWTDMFGYSELALRSLSVFFGILTVVFVYKIAKLIDEKRGVLYAVFSSLLLATSQIHIYYSQEARMYVMAGLFATAAIYYFLKTMNKNFKATDFILFSLFYTGLIFTDYMPIFLYPVFFVYALLKRKGKKWWGYFILANIPLAALGYLWLPTFLYQSEKGKWLLQTLPAWQELAGGATFKQAVLIWAKFVFGRISLVSKKLYYFLVGIVSIPFAFLLFKARKTKATILWMWLLLPVTLGFLASFAFPAFIYFRYIYVLPAFYLLVAKGLMKLSYIGRIVVFSILIFSNLVSWTIYVSDRKQQREEWRQAVDYLEENVQRGDIVVFDYPEPFAPYQWYDPQKFMAVGVADSIFVNAEKTSENTRKAISDRDGVYYFNYLVELTDPGMVARKAIEESGFVEKKKVSFVGVGEITYFVRE